MLEAIALFAPSLIALRFYSHLRGNQLSARALVMSYGIFVVFVNLCMYLVQLYLLGQDSVQFDGKSFVTYTLSALVLAFVLPFVVNLIETTISIDVKRNAKKK
mgnify:CR=1 FL=1